MYANLDENKIMTTLIKRLSNTDQKRKIRNIALDFNKRIINNHEKSPYLKAFLEKTKLLISLAAKDSALTKQRTTYFDSAFIPPPSVLPKT
jgi:hypothetical protein